ncbi:MAG: hypothetical protein A3K19_04310 [Lentisphaerae bacterium RIFOXYB12_FULL_65_16]|nr:MAG: hypothetical protein A3K18_09390 [Lentisphaerae bacterium RIFOXYA12_64_32]OGV84306.1 MAG: hypothetical protein A3K19_04310 [Lentisphaerae bacterium RIFOXYB12_FULL_65_16]
MIARFLSTSVAIVTFATAATAAPAPLLYAPFDAPLASGGPGMASQALELTDGLRGKAAVLRSDCQFAVPGNFRVETGTVAAWVRPHWTGTDPASHVFFCLYGQRDGRPHYGLNRWTISFGGGQCTFVIYSLTEGVTFAVSAPVSEWKPGDWHHVAATWAGVNSGKPDASMALFLDGAPVANLAGKQIDVGPTDTVMAVGRDQDGSPDYLDGDIDDLFIYGEALPPADIASAVKTVRNGTAAYDQPAAAPATRNVAGWWNAAWPFRAAMVMPAGAAPGGFFQCPLRIAAEAASLAPSAAVDPDSLRLVDPQGNVIPLRVEDGIAEWQQPNLPDAGAPTLYFQAYSYEVAEPLLSRRIMSAAAETAPAPQPPPVPDYATAASGKPWDFNDGTFCGIDQWGNKPEFLRNRKVENGILSMDVSVDPFFIWGDMWGQVDTTHQKLAIDLDKYPVLEMRVRQSVDSAPWELFGRVGAAESLLNHKFTVTGKAWQRLHIDLRHDVRWRGVLSAFRIDPTSGVDAHVEIDWVRLIASTHVEHAATETIGAPAAPAARIQLEVPQRTIAAGATQDIAVTVIDAAGVPVAGQPVRVFLAKSSNGVLADVAGAKSLAMSPTSARRALTDANGRFALHYTANRQAKPGADLLAAVAEFAPGPVQQDLIVDTVPGPAHHYRVEPAKVIALRSAQLPLAVRAQLVDAFDNPVSGAGTLRWSTDEGGTVAAAATPLNATGSAQTEWRGDESKRWVYTVRVEDDQGLKGESAAVCLLPSQPRQDPIVLDPNGYFRKGANGPAWLPLGGFYANWVGIPQDGEEGRRLISFVDATEEQLVHWLEYLASQGVNGMRFMLRAHTPRGMEPLDVAGRVNMPLFAKILRYLDLARKHDIRFMLTVHEDYTKPAYFSQQAFDTFCAPYYAGENLDALPPYQRRFVRDRQFLENIADKYTDPDAMACQDQYTRELFGLLKDNPQLFSWEFENEMVNCPESWSRHMAELMRAADPVTPICASHGGGGMHTADPLWWTKRSGIDFYTYHLYPHRGSTSEVTDFGAAADVLTCYGRMAGVCMFGETAGDEFGYYPKAQDADRRYIMRDLIWFALANGNPGCFFWNARGIEVEQFLLANRITAGFDWREWKRQRPDAAVLCPHDWTEDKYYRSKQGLADYAMMGRYAQHFLSAGVDFDFAMDNSAGYAKTATLATFETPQAEARIKVGSGWQVRFNAREGYAEGYAYVRNFAGTRQWREEGKGGMSRCDMFLRSRAPAPLQVQLNLPGDKLAITATDLDTGEERAFSVPGNGTLDLGATDHDWAICWRAAR